MNTHSSNYQHIFTATIILVALSGIANFVQAQPQISINRDQLAANIHYELFGDYGPLYVLTGKTTAKRWYLDGRRAPPREGLFSPAMRRVAGNICSRRNDRATNRSANRRAKQTNNRAAYARRTQFNNRHQEKRTKKRGATSIDGTPPSGFQFITDRIGSSGSTYGYVSNR